MELKILDTSYEPQYIIDVFQSMIWTDRYSEYGDFEIFTEVNDENLNVFKDDLILTSDESEHSMFIESRQITTDVEDGNKLIVTGRSLETILYRRIVWGQVTLSGNLQDAIESLLNDNIIAPTDPNRTISNFIFVPSADVNITSLVIEAQFTGEYIYDAVKQLCDTHNIGFKVILNDGVFEFSLYAGEDRSYDQVENPFVVFSPEYDNMLNSNYIESKKNLKNATLIGGEGEGSDRTLAALIGIQTGLDRRETFTDASGLSSTIEGGTLTPAEYEAQLIQKGTEELKKFEFIESFEGQVEPTILYIYGEDFYMGDIVQIENEYGIKTKSRVIEVVSSQSTSGVEVYPTFATVDS